MGEINLSRDEQEAIGAIDVDAINELIDRSLRQERLDPQLTQRLWRCGLYVASQLGSYERALEAYAKAKTAKKRAETEDRARRAGRDLAFAVEQMKRRLETEAQEGQLFHVDDQIIAPYRFSECLTVCVRYRWRQAIEAEWTYGSITFSYDLDLRADYLEPRPKRKPSVAKQVLERQDKLYRE